jgi:signal transduction histidine kinase
MTTPAESTPSGGPQLLSLVVEAAPVALVVIDGSGKIVLINATAERLFGYNRDELRDGPVERLIPGAMGGGRDLCGRRKDGSEIPIEITFTPLKTQGRDFVLSTITDITERKLAEQFRTLNVEFGQHALAVADVRQLKQEAAELLAQALGAPLVRIGAHDALSNVVTFDAGVGWPEHLLDNHQFHVAGSAEAAEAIETGRPVFARFDVLDSPYTPSEECKRQGIVASATIPIRGKDPVVGLMSVATREPKTFSADEIAFMAGIGTIVGMAIDRDRREQRITRLNEELRHQFEELESFSYSVAHDLRAPLRTLAGFAHALQEDYGPSLDGDAHRFIERLVSGATQMGQLIDALLSLARVSRQEVSREIVDLSAVGESLVADLRAADPDRHAIVDIAPNLVVTGDAALLRAALQNLLSNAWKFTRDRDPALLSVWGERSNGEVTIAVKDNGVGFSTGYPKELFVPFKRLHGSTFEGTGIGLATVERIVSRHGGRIWAESELDKGATFFFTVNEADR